MGPGKRGCLQYATCISSSEKSGISKTTIVLSLESLNCSNECLSDSVFCLDGPTQEDT